MAKKRRCGKRPYTTHAEADAALARMLNRYPSIVYKKIYRCGKCKAWHITSTPRGISRPSRVKH
jgi:hypothetical protein